MSQTRGAPFVVQAPEGYARDLSYFVANPLAGDQIAYEIHPYNPATDFDHLIVDKVVAEICAEHGVDPPSDHRFRRTLKEAAEKAKWELGQVDVAEVNRLRDGYNRWYVLEKECAVRSHAVARQGFVPLPPLTSAELAEHLPLLPVPRVK